VELELPPQEGIMPTAANARIRLKNLTHELASGEGLDDIRCFPRAVRCNKS
jgi:hypothetical protein